jgi:membrane protein implicated in regulation of membrane protease activity
MTLREHVLYRLWLAAIDAAMIMMALIFGWYAAIGMLGGLVLAAGFAARRDYRREQKSLAAREESDRIFELTRRSSRDDATRVPDDGLS